MEREPMQTTKNNAGTHNLYVARISGSFRVVVSGTRRIARNAQGTPVDGVGHATWQKAFNQARAITNANIRAKRICPPCR